MTSSTKLKKCEIPLSVKFSNFFKKNVNFFLFQVCDLFFSPTSCFKPLHLCKSLKNSTLCIIKPHALLEGKTGCILHHITCNGLVIKGMKMFDLPRKNCEEFYEVYNGVSPDYLVRIHRHSNYDRIPKIVLCVIQQMVTELSSGPFIAVEIGSSDSNVSAYEELRRLCGPFDPVRHFILLRILFFQ